MFASPETGTGEKSSERILVRELRLRPKSRLGGLLLVDGSNRLQATSASAKQG
jgi:hypothetical protein